MLVDQLFAFDDLRKGRPELQAWIGAASLPDINEAVAVPVHCSAATDALISRIYAEDRALYRLVMEGKGPLKPVAILRQRPRSRRASMPATLPP